MSTDYLVVIETTGKNLSAYSPDLPGCVATGATEDEVRERMAAAIRMHIDGLAEDGAPIPQPTAKSTTVAPASG